MYKADQSRQF